MKLGVVAADLPENVYHEFVRFAAAIRAEFDALAAGQRPWLDNPLSPPQITANQNDYEPTGWAGTNWVRVTSDANRTITGLKATTVGEVRLISNVGPWVISLAHIDSLSAAGNRIRCPGGAAHALNAGESSWVLCDQLLGQTETVWRVIK